MADGLKQKKVPLSPSVPSGWKAILLQQSDTLPCRACTDSPSIILCWRRIGNLMLKMKKNELSEPDEQKLVWQNYW